MLSREVTIQGSSYLLVDVEPVFQHKKTFYLGKIKSRDLVGMFTVSPTKYDIEKNASLAKSFVSDTDYYQHLASHINNIDGDMGFQRSFKKERAAEIKNFLETEEYPFFPNTVIASCDLINDIEESGLDVNSQFEDFQSLENRPDHLSFLYKEHETQSFQLLIPKKSKSILVIDGQHRLEGLKQCSPEYQEDYDVLVAFIIGYDRSVIARQFYTINYEQKSVNRSLLLHLTGEFSQELSEITFLHNVVRLLNEHETSPFFKRIKMLGTAPLNTASDGRRMYSISQAFLIDHMVRFIDRRLIDSKAYLPIFLYYYQHENYHIEIIRFLIRYFSAVRDLKNDWNEPQNSILSKGMGVGAFLIALHTIFPILFLREGGRNPDFISGLSVEYLKTKLSGIENIDLTRGGVLSGSGGAGTINRIRNEILAVTGLQDRGEKDEFQKWLRANTK